MTSDAAPNQPLQETRVAYAIARYTVPRRPWLLSQVVRRQTRMGVDESQLVGILRIGHDTSMRSNEGLSLRQAIARSDYDRLRPDFSPAELVPLLKANPELIKQWLMYCEDKRTSCGYWVSEDRFEVGTLESREAILQFQSLEEAVAEFVVAELDYWSEVGRRTIRCSRPGPLSDL